MRLQIVIHDLWIDLPSLRHAVLERRRWRHDINLGMRWQRPEGLNHACIIFVVALFKVLWELRIVRAELKNNNVRPRLAPTFGVVKFSIVPIRVCTRLQHRSFAYAEISNLKILSKHLLKLIGVWASAPRPASLTFGDASTDASYLALVTTFVRLCEERDTPALHCG